MELREIISRNLVELRKQNKLTQAELAEKLNYTDKAISKWERGESIPEITTLKQIADLFDVTVDLLLTENAVKEIRKYSIPKNIKRNRKIIAASSSLVVWIIAIVVFIYGYVYVPNYDDFYLAFVCAVPMNAVVLYILSKKWGLKKQHVYLLSIFLWSFLVSIYLFTMMYETWLIFIIGLPIQALIILLCLLKK